MQVVKKKEEYRVSKWLSSSFLIDNEEFGCFVKEMGDFSLFQTGEILSSLSSLSIDDWKKEYAEYTENPLKKLSALLMTYDVNAVYPLEVREGSYLFYPRYPVIQVREHQFSVTSDNRIQSMVFGKDSIRWGLIFSYPQIFYDPVQKKIVEVLKEKSSNTEGFRRLQKWVRDFTKPASFLINGKKINATFRIGKKRCLIENCTIA